MNIVQDFYTVAHNHPKRLAVIDGNSVVNYSDLRIQVKEIMGGYKRKNLKKGDAILLMIPVSILFYSHLLAAFSLGLKVVLVDGLKPIHRLQYAVETINVKYIVTSKVLKLASYIFLPANLWKKTTYIASGPMVDSFQQMAQSDTALITFTSGTTGIPKAADRSHGFLEIQLRTLSSELQLAERKMHLSSFPVVLLCNLAHGVTSILPFDGKRSIFRRRPNYPVGIDLVSGSPHHIDAFLKHASIQNCDVFIGGATILPHFLQKISSLLSLSRIKLIYGSTEAEPISMMDATEYKASNEGELGICVGRSHPEINIRIAPFSDRRHNEESMEKVGEILVSGPHVLDRYYRNEKALYENKIIEGDILWHRTGDAGYVKNGKVYYLGRVNWVKYMKDGRVFSPTVVEKIFSEKRGVNATMLHINDKNILFLEGGNIPIPELPYSVDEVITVSDFKRDKRHRSRIDYSYLEDLASKSLDV